MRCWFLASLAVVSACAHAELTGEEHREAAARDLKAAEQERAKFDPGATAVAVDPRGAFADDPAGPRFYNPTADSLDKADRKMQSAFKHLEAARKLEAYQDLACSNLPTAQKTACPLIGPSLVKVEEGSRGVILHFSSVERAKELVEQMRCHLAFAQANDFDRVPCPLYMKGVQIAASGDKAIAVTSADPAVAARVRLEARQLFGQAPDAVSAR